MYKKKFYSQNFQNNWENIVIMNDSNEILIHPTPSVLIMGERASLHMPIAIDSTPTVAFIQTIEVPLRFIWLI